MDKLTSLIVDNEITARNTLRTFLDKYCPEVTVVAEAASIHEAVMEVNTYDPLLVFLDINMPYENGFDLFNKIPKPGFHTIFVTAYDAYALDAIKCHAIDYILKPINIDELICAVQHAAAVSFKPGVETNLSVRSEPARPIKSISKLALPVLEGFLYVEKNDVIRCEAEGSYTMFYFINRPKLLISRPIGSFEDQLKDDGFIRVHHHHLINIAHVERYHRGRSGIVAMSDKMEVPVSQRRKDEFLGIMERGYS